MGDAGIGLRYATLRVQFRSSMPAAQEHPVRKHPAPHLRRRARRRPLRHPSLLRLPAPGRSAWCARRYRTKRNSLFAATWVGRFHPDSPVPPATRLGRAPFPRCEPAGASQSATVRRRAIPVCAPCPGAASTHSRCSSSLSFSTYALQATAIVINPTGRVAHLVASKGALPSVVATTVASTRRSHAPAGPQDVTLPKVL